MKLYLTLYYATFTNSSQDPEYKMLSFETISGYGENGAVIHYRANNFTVRQIGTDSTYLLDSGGNYL